MEYQIAIPSYARAEILRDKTLAFLDAQNISTDIVTVFVASEEERKRYAEVLANKWRIVVGCLNKLEQQKFYHTHYPKGMPLLNIDDDVSNLRQRTTDGKLEDFTGNIGSLVEQMFGICQQEGAKMWGINPVENGFFMKDVVTVGLKFIVGTFYGNYAGDESITSPTRQYQSSCEDFETSLRSFITNGAVIRAEYLAPKTKYWATGGMDASLATKGYANRQVSQEEVLRDIVNRYTDLVTLTSNKGGLMLRFKPITYKKIPRV